MKKILYVMIGYSTHPINSYPCTTERKDYER